MKALLQLVAFGFAVALATPAAAHVGLRYPPSRYGDNVLKSGPCGIAGGARTSHVTVLEPGASITVVWDEYVNHPGHFRLSFDAEGDNGFVDPKCLNGCSTTSPKIELYSNDSVLLDGIADTPYGGVSGAQITLPDIECDRCTLQLIQVMYDKPPYVTPGNDIYYQCADLVLRRSVALPTPTPSPTMSPSPELPTPTSSPTAPPSATPPTPVRCVGDCDQDGAVKVDELILGVNIALGITAIDVCPSFDANSDDAVTVDDLIAALNRAMSDCATAAQL
ncbi:MAG: hypothetical protein HYR72_07900 [Deltaproteobacteria bacterium]|nr:hypothetical protein [Deltaproteobacteria bacterium]MBI3387012.1 hypothetical protein [Deltaproteobacteria bacterium]